MTDDDQDRTGGAWIGQQPDENTSKVRDELDDGAERVAVTNNESGESPADDGRPRGRREGDQAGDDDIRNAGESH